MHRDWYERTRLVREEREERGEEVGSGSRRGEEVEYIYPYGKEEGDEVKGNV